MRTTTLSIPALARCLAVALALTATAAGCGEGPTAADDAGAEDATPLDAACREGEVGCTCGEDDACATGVCVEGTCLDCRIGDEDCACRSTGTCGTGLACDAERNVCVTCEPGTDGCACATGDACETGLSCSSIGVCVPDECTDGALDCPCRASVPECDGDATFCDDGMLCRACSSDVEGCPCDAGAVCTGGLVCDSADACRAARTCADLRTAGLCGEHQVCREETGADATCVASTCESGYRWSAFTMDCVACTTTGCTDEPSCPDLDCAAENRECVDTAGIGECTTCLTGTVEVGGVCTVQSDCGGVTCAASQYCDVLGPAGPTCTAWPCPTANQVRGSDGTCSVTCTRSCSVPGSTGRYWPYADDADNCVCETLQGWWFDNGGAIDPVECDADEDGWVRDEVRDILDAASRDDALYANARCTIRSAGSVELVDEYGEATVIDSCASGLLQDRDAATACTVVPLRLFETLRNDVEGEAERLGEAPAYDYGGRRLHPRELNSLTKACVTPLGDYDDDGIEDVAQVQPHPSDTSALGETARLRAFSHFVELYRTGYVAPASASTHGRIRIEERSRCDADFALGFSATETSYASTVPSSYWRNCERRRAADYDGDVSEAGYDFAQWSCSARRGSCDAPGAPANATHTTVPDPDVSLLRGHGLCELAGAAPADGIFRGMSHHSMFQCVNVVADPTTVLRAYDRTQRSFGGAGTLTFNECRVTDCTGMTGCTDSVAPLPVPGTWDPVFECTPRPFATIAEGRVGWAAVAYSPYAHTSTSGTTDATTYTLGCVNEDAEWPDLCPSPEYGRCTTAPTDAFGRYRCFGWEGLALWGGAEDTVDRSDLAWAGATGSATNMSIWNPETASSCL